MLAHAHHALSWAWYNLVMIPNPPKAWNNELIRSLSNHFSFYSLPKLQKKKVTVRDLESVDEEFYNSIVWIRDNNIEVW